jgi:hypothetical protein
LRISNASASNPGAFTPSSFVTRICIPIDLQIQVKAAYYTP